MNRSIKVYSISLGCPKNRVDAEAVLGSMPGGVRIVADPAQADLVVINTCSFIKPAVEESVRVILDTAEAIRGLSPRPKLAVTGCLPGRYGEELRAGLPEVDVWGLPSELAELPGRLIRAVSPDGPGLSDLRRPFPGTRLVSTPPGFAYVKIAEGCNHACAYCTIPSIRGRLVSRPVADIVAEAAGLVAGGASELILVAQDLTAYGRDMGKGKGLRELMEGLLPLPGLSRLRLMYLYPSGLDAGFLDFLAAAGPPLLPYFDIPFQHAHPDVLRAMGRPRSDAPEAIVARVRQRFPEAAIRTTFITGFPGETPRRFQAVLDFVARERLHHVGVFPFSPEEGTRAVTLPGKVSGAEARRRRDALMELQAEISADILAGYVGQTLPVLVDAPHPEWPGLFVGRTWFQAPEADGVTYVSGPGVAPGKLVMAEIVESKDYDLVALADG
ncbi:30S ribosomal protein S12 methylthiotransferase RimO [Desulfolutivibrio sp.]|uniref:30S ribosomal protein S12 methylthiotransferase RimO n=1 Tax=Desulfolutivibrio sp. TaxID=2773296 RepID=UPI002F961E4D